MMKKFATEPKKMLDMGVLQYYTFTINAEEISKEELQFLIQPLQLMRQTIKNVKRQDYDEQHRIVAALIFLT